MQPPRCLIAPPRRLKPVHGVSFICSAELEGLTATRGNSGSPQKFSGGRNGELSTRMVTPRFTMPDGAFSLKI